MHSLLMYPNWWVMSLFAKQEVHSQLCTQKAVLQRISESLKMMYSDKNTSIPEEIEGLLQDVSQSLQEVEGQVWCILWMVHNLFCISTQIWHSSKHTLLLLVTSNIYRLVFYYFNMDIWQMFVSAEMTKLLNLLHAPFKHHSHCCRISSLMN